MFSLLCPNFDSKLPTQVCVLMVSPLIEIDLNIRRTHVMHIFHIAMTETFKSLARKSTLYPEFDIKNG